MTQGSTLERIHAAAAREFLEKGYQRASLRNIVRKAGVTTGALYGYYASKEALFGALVKDAYDYVLGAYKRAQEDFASLPADEQPAALESVSGACMQDILRYAFDHRDQCSLLFCQADGTPYAGLIDEMVEIEVDATHRYWATLEELGSPAPPVDPHLEHMLITGMFNTFLELIRHEMSYEEAAAYLEQMRAFYSAGWRRLMVR